MPPTRKLSALVWFAAHLSLVNDSEPEPDSEEEAVGEFSAALLSPLLESSPQAAREKLRRAVPAISLAHVAVLDRFTGGTFLSRWATPPRPPPRSAGHSPSPRGPGPLR